MTLQNTSATSLRFSLQPAVTGTSIVADIRRASIYDGASIDSQTNDNLTISGVFVVDDLIYSQSQEMHWTRIRQQEPSTGLWSMCEIRIFFFPRRCPYVCMRQLAIHGSQFPGTISFLSQDCKLLCGAL